MKGVIFLLVMILGSAFFTNSYAFTNGNSEKNLGENVYPYGQGILKFQETDTGPCNYNIPNFDVKTVNLSKDNLLNLDNVENNFFIVLGNVNDEYFQYLQIGLPTGEGNPAYLLDFKKGEQKLRGEFYVGYKNLAVVVELDGKETPLADESYKKYFEGDSKDITYSTHTFGPGKYDFGAILLKSDGSSWINSDKCVIRIDYPVTITNEEKIISSEPIAKIGLLSDITGQFSPLQQHKSGVNPDSIECKPGLQMVLQQIDESGDKRPACVKPETAEKLAQRGWLKTEISINNTGSLDISNDSMNAVLTISNFKDVSFRSQTTDSLFSKFGQPDNDIGSGIHIYVYKLDDSTQIWIGYTDHVLYVAHLDSAGNSLEQLYSENEN